MGKQDALEQLAAVAESSGLIDERSDGVVMISGGPDSACAAAALAGFVGPHRVHALHVNYGLRDTADRDERVARDLCALLRLDLHVERLGPNQLKGNLQAAARAARYAAAERLRARTGAGWIATGHTRSDVAETVIYRLATSPGSRALLAMPPRSGRIVRPLLALTRVETRELATATGLPFADDPTNADPAFARVRIRERLLPELTELSGVAERNIAETRAELAEEAVLLERLALEALESAGAGAGDTVVAADVLTTWHPALRRLALRALAERAAGRQVALGRERASDITRIAAHPEGGEIHLGGGVRAICESGLIRFAAATLDAAPVPEPVTLSLPGRCRLGGWELTAKVTPAPALPSGPDLATLDAAALAGPMEVRTWRQGDRIRPLGMTGTKTLGDLFADNRVPRSERGNVPIVLAAGQVAWVPGVAVADDFRLDATSGNAAVLTANRG